MSPAMAHFEANTLPFCLVYNEWNILQCTASYEASNFIFLKSSKRPLLLHTLQAAGCLKIVNLFGTRLCEWNCCKYVETAVYNMLAPRMADAHWFASCFNSPLWDPRQTCDTLCCCFSFPVVFSLKQMFFYILNIHFFLFFAYIGKMCCCILLVSLLLCVWPVERTIVTSVLTIFEK